MNSANIIRVIFKKTTLKIKKSIIKLIDDSLFLTIFKKTEIYEITIANKKGSAEIEAIVTKNIGVNIKNKIV